MLIFVSNKLIMMNIAIGNDHAGTDFKNMILEKLKKKGYKVENFGTDKNDSVDYPDFVHPVAQAVENKDADFGIVICGSGNGASMTANKHAGVRCALCWNKEITALARQHNNANILSLPARFITMEEADKMVDIFFETEFEGGRHERRIEKMPCS